MAYRSDNADSVSRGWDINFVEKTGINSGYVSCISDLDKVLKDYELCTKSKFIPIKNDALFGKESAVDLKQLKFEIRWADTQSNAVPQIPFSGVPFMIVGKKKLECHQGRDRNKKKKEKWKRSAENVTDHAFQRKRKHAQQTKKKECPAQIKMRHIIRFPEFEASQTLKSRHDKDKISGNIKAAINTGKDIKLEHQYHINLSPEHEHRNHFRGEAACIIHPLDEDLRKEIQVMVSENNITSPTQMKILLEVHLKKVMFQGQPLPVRTNKRFWPSMKDIRNHMALALMRHRSSNVDQLIVAEMVKKWEDECPQDRFYLRLKEANDNETSDINSFSGNDIEDDDDDIILGDNVTELLYGSKQKFLFIHQTQWQQRLLSRYGNEICLLDATYRTTRYALPVYFLCVPTNVNYITVGTFILETEDSNSLEEALTIIKSWNNSWNPKYFMCDCADEEIKSLEKVFRDSFVYLCDFHREQAWDRWLNGSHNGVSQNKSEILELFRAIARASTEEEYLANKAKLESSNVWCLNQRLQNWFQRIWLSKHKRWVRAFRQDRFMVNINTNNGVERQNKSLKYEYLEMRKANSLSHLLNILINKFLTDSYLGYIRLNLSSSDQAREYSECIPQFLRNRPKHVVKHCMKRWEEGEQIPVTDIDDSCSSDGIFLVRSQSHPTLTYSISFSDESGFPSCQCVDWKSSHLPCKHFMGVFRCYPQWSWDSLPDCYKMNPFINLDVENFLTEAENVADSHSSAEIAELENSQVEETSTPVAAAVTNLPLPKAAALKRERSQIGGLCQMLRDWVYHCDDFSKLLFIRNEMTATLSWLRTSLPKDGSFLLAEGHMTKPKKKKTTPKRISKPIKSLHRLPSRLKRKKWSGRHGEGSEKLKKAHTKKGVNELSTMSSDVIESDVIEEGIPSELEIPITVNADSTSSSVSSNEQETSIMLKLKDTKSERINNSTQDAEYSQRKTGRKVTFKKPLEEVPLKSFENIRPETTNVTNTNNIYNVNGYKINQQSFDDLDSDLPDEVMNAFISVKVGNCKGKSVGFVSSSTMTSIFFDPIDINEPFPSHGYLNEINFEQYEMLIGAVCENSNHWCLMAIFLQKRQLLYMNPLGEHAVKKNQYLQAWILFLNERYNRGIGSLPNMEWEILTKSHRKQLDSISCGVFTLKFTELLLDGCENFNFDTTKRGLRAQRHVIGQYLVEHSDEFKSYRNREPSLILNEDEVDVTDSEEVVESIIISTAGDTSDINIEDGLTSMPSDVNIYINNEEGSAELESQQRDSDNTSRNDDNVSFKESHNDEKESAASSGINVCISNGAEFESQQPESDDTDNDNIDDYDDASNKESRKYNKEKYPDNQTTGLLNYNLRNNPPKKRRMSSFIYPDIPQKMKKKSIPYEFCLSKIPVMFDRLKVMMRCSDENCDAIDHGRHHEFIRNPEAVYERERTRHCFGNDFFGQKIYEEIHMLLDKEFICLTRDKRHPYTGGIKRKIKNLPDCPLQNVFETHGLLAHTYIQCVCVKEIFVWIVCEYKNCPYEFADEQCQLTEVSVRNMVKGIKMKNKLNEN